MFKRISFVVVIFLALLGVLAYLKYQQVKAGMAMGAKFAPGPAAVSTVVVQPQAWQPVLSSVGSLRAVDGVTLSTDLAGIVSKISFESGAPVKKGDLLVELDSHQEDAQLHVAEAKLEFAKTDLGRKKDLIEKKAISASDLDTAQSNLREAAATVEEAKALISRKHVVAPFDGVIGIRQVSPGQFLNPGAMIAGLQSVDPILVEFNLPQQHLEVLSLGKKLRVTVAGAAGQEFSGELTAIDSKVDETTRNVTLQGTIANADRKLRPGMFVNVEVLLPSTDQVLAVPSSAIAYALYGDSVFRHCGWQGQGRAPT